MIRHAAISPCGQYRYWLSREWAPSDRMPLMWIMLNPSTADAEIDDPTIRRCIAFSKEWGYGSMRVGNLFAFRATNPRDLFDAPDPVGPQNAYHLNRSASTSAAIVCAWGGHWMASNGIAKDILRRIVQPGGLWCLGRTKSGAPRHPLYVKSSTPLVEYQP